MRLCDSSSHMLSCGLCVNMSTVIIRLCFHQVIMLSSGLCVNMSVVNMRLHVSPSHYVVMWIMCQHVNSYHEASFFTKSLCCHVDYVSTYQLLL